jgi:plasmid replication initiation protein
MGKNINLETIEELKNYPVVKANKLVEAKYKLSISEIKLVFTLISQIKPDDEAFKMYSIKIKDLMKMFGVNSENYYTTIKTTLKGLLSKPIVIEDIKCKGDYLICNWVASAKYIKKEGVINIELSQQLKPYLLELKSHFTILELDRILKLKSVYSIRLYEILLKEYCYYGKKKISFVFSIKELKAMLGLEVNQYSEIITFKRKILDIAERELKEKSTFYFEYKTIKTGRAITDIEFFVINEEKKENKQQKQLTTKDDSQKVLDLKSYPVEKKIEADEIIKRLIELGFQDCQKIKSDHSDEVLLDAIADLDYEIAYRKKNNKEPIKNVGAWVRKRLPIAGQPFQKSLHHQRHLQDIEKNKQREELKQQEELKAKIEREKREKFIKELDEKVNQKIEDLQLHFPDEWEAIEKEVSDKVNSELKPPTLEKEKRELTKKIISELSEQDRKVLEIDAVEKAKASLIGLGITEDSSNFTNLLKSVKTSTFEAIIKEKYASKIQSILKEDKYYKAYEKKVITESNEIRRSIIIKKLKDDI